MTSRFLLTDIKHEEGVRLAAYPDPLTGGDPWTIGVGHTGPDVKKGDTCTPPQADVWLRADVDAVKHGLDSRARWWWNVDDNRQDVLVQMGFQLGLDGLMQFTRTLEAVQAGRYQDAADYMLDSKWAREDTPARAARMSAQMRSGQRAWAFMDGR